MSPHKTKRLLSFMRRELARLRDEWATGKPITPDSELRAGIARIAGRDGKSLLAEVDRVIAKRRGP